MSSQKYTDYVRPSALVTKLSRNVLVGGDVSELHDVVAPKLGELPHDISQQLKRDFYKRHDTAIAQAIDGKEFWSTKHAAQDWLAAEVEEFCNEKIHRAFDEHEVRALAHRWSVVCSRMHRLEAMQGFAVSVGIQPPIVGVRVSSVGAARRLSCAKWWRRQLRKHYTRRAESHLRSAGFVHRRRQLYASDRAVAYRKQRKNADKVMLQSMEAVSDAGDQLPLFDIVEKSQANPTLRRNELMVRMRGFEELAKMAGHEAIFVSPTCPSAFHRMHANGTKNERWEGFTPRGGQEWLCKMWARVRSKLKRAKVSIYGFRVAEPHHDATPHWHMVLFGSRRSLALVRRYLSTMWRSEYASELGMWKHRITFKKINPLKGSATGYIAKYIAKNIDGFQVGEDYEAENKTAVESVDRVAAWASAHAIRQFQQIGGPSVTLWREIRRLRSSVGVEQIEAARKAADAGEWSAFVSAIGGIAAGRNTQLTLWKVWSDQENQYGEPKGWRVVGVQGPGLRLPEYALTDGAQRSAAEVRAISIPCVARIRTRKKTWRIQRKAETRHSVESGGAVSGPRVSPSPTESVHDEVELALRVSRERRRIAKAGWSSLAPFRSSSSLGPVSTTVRILKSVPSQENFSRTRDVTQTSRGDPPCLH